MRLDKIKLSGFKSFVDPTVVPCPSNLIGIVGPNGCGKSNLIDAVRWVMGERSAKQLRGESMEDVIFNGSQGRAPVGQASVELVFDNSDGTITGEYANYRELSLRRVVSRDGVSNYYLNNTRCTRKEITDIFLGTGLGPHGYSIIEQGRISRVIEAKPEDLRIYLEEAAGISKYKERRRETENRIRHTRDNLDRLTDIRDELGKQLERLDRQAKAAEKYQTLRQQERTVKAQLLALRWQVLDATWQREQHHILELGVQFESYQADVRANDKHIVVHKATLMDVTDEFNRIQEQYYGVGNEISRLEQAIDHQRQRKQQLQQDCQQAQVDLAVAQQHLAQDEQSLATLNATLATTEPALQQQQATVSAASTHLATIEQQQTDWQTAWDVFNNAAAESSKMAHVEQARMIHVDGLLNSAKTRMTRLQQEQVQQHDPELVNVIAQLQEQQTVAVSAQQQAQQALQQAQQTLLQARQTITQTEQQLNDARNARQTQQGRLASLEVLQQAALGKQSGAVMAWLKAHDLGDARRLAEHVTVTDGWETAVETVLGDYLQAVCIDNLTQVQDWLRDMNCAVTFVTDTNARRTAPTSDSLASKVQGDSALLQQLLGNVLIAEDIVAAMTQLPKLSATQSVITRDGIWLSQHWVRVAKEQDETAGVLAREQEIKVLTTDLVRHDAGISELTELLASEREQLAQIEAEREAQQHAVTEAAKQSADCQAKLQVNQAKERQLAARAAAILQELQEIETHLAHDQSELMSAKSRWQEAMAAMSADAEQRDQMLKTRDSIKQQAQTAREQQQQLLRQLHDLEMQRQTQITQAKALHDTIVRIKERINECEQRYASLQLALQQTHNPEDNLPAKLATALTQHQAIEKQLHAARERVALLEQQCSQHERAKQQAEQQARAIEQQVQQLQITAQSVLVRRTTIEEQLAETDFQLQQLLETMPAEAQEAAWEQTLQQLNNSITRLGAINLAAIEEYKTESERKSYLDQQHQDLVEALTTLEDAISKIDKETRGRFKETFDFVNSAFSKLFPRLFGGGKGFLELTGQDLLDTGVTVMAQPPGKKNSTIHLLSGGEKALTAVALVFAIFQLNPSPFCLLDEVDAPLDDANVTRFCNMVREMSQQTQFIVITHNKVTMELAQHLAGVTMHEPGVSRLVAVDIDEAVSLVDA